MTLPSKQALFVEQYLIDLNATQAAIRAGYSAKTAEQQGPRLLGNVGVAAAISAAMTARSKRTHIDQDRVLHELARIGLATLSDVTDWGMKEVAFGYDAEGKKLRPEDIEEAAVVRYEMAPFVTPRNRDDLPDDIRAAVAEVSLGKDGFKIKMHDKLNALTKLGQHLGMFADKLDVNHTGHIEVIINKPA